MRRLVLAALLAAAVPAVAGAQPPVFRQGTDGKSLYDANCFECHGPHGHGTPRGPSLQGAGARGADFYLRTGYMPLERPTESPARRPALFSDAQLDALIRYVASIAPGPPVPAPHPERGDMALGQRLFTDHCAGCHQVVAAGGYVTGARVPPLSEATATQIAEAVRLGPYLMPRFSRRQISAAGLDSIVRYVEYAKHPADPGGWALGHVGPVPEGLVTWFVAMVALVGACVVFGTRLRS